MRAFGPEKEADETSALRRYTLHSAKMLPPKKTSAWLGQPEPFAPVAQGIEHRFPKPRVAGSNPARRTFFSMPQTWLSVFSRPSRNGQIRLLASKPA